MRFNRLATLLFGIALLATVGPRGAFAAPSKVSYDLRMPSDLLFAIGKFWAKRTGPPPVSVDGAFISASVAKRLEAAGYRVKRFTAEGAATISDVPRNYYFPDCCWRVSTDVVYVWWETVLLHDDNEKGILEARREHGTWRVRDLPLAGAPPVGIQVAICKGLWKPANGHKVALFIHGSPDALKRIRDPHVTIVDKPMFSKTGDWLNLYFGGMGDLTGGIRWIDNDHAFVTFQMQSSEVYKRLVSIGGDDTVTRYAYRSHGNWTIVDIGVPVDDE